MIRKRIRKWNKKTMTVVLAGIFGILFVGVLVGSLLARYIATNREKAEVISSNFHISSNYLKEENNTYTVTDWGYQDDHDIIFELYNYEEDNTALISATPIAYKIDLPAGWTVTVKDENGNTVSPANHVYTLPGITKTSHTVILKRTGTDKLVDVTVTTTAPYKTKLSARFTLAEPHDFEYTVVDGGNYVTVFVHSNNYAGTLNVTWPLGFSPDNTNPYMKEWNDTEKTGSFTAEEHTVYELIFLKNTADADENGIVVEE